MGLFSKIKYDIYDGKRLKNSMNVRYVKISKRVIGIDNQTFMDFKNLGDVIMPETVEFIGNEAFLRCEGLLEFKMPDSVLSVGDRTFDGCTSLRQIKLSEYLAGISREMFAGCKLLETLVIPEKVRNIGDDAFKNCESLQKLIFKCETPPTIYEGILSQVNKNCKLYVPEKFIDRYRAAHLWNDIEPYIRPIDKTVEKIVKDGWEK